MKGISPARHEQRNVLQQNGGLDEDYDGTVDYPFDGRELIEHLHQHYNCNEKFQTEQ